MTIEELENISKLYAKNIPMFKLIDSRSLTKNLTICRRCDYKKIYSKSRALVTEEDLTKHSIQTRRKEIESYVNLFLQKLKENVKPEIFNEIAKKMERVAVKYGISDFTPSELEEWNKHSSTVKGISLFNSWSTLTDKNTDIHTILHEMMHQATTVVEQKGYGKKFFCGFEYQDLKFGALEPTIIGRGLNEGMTDSLIEDLYGLKSKDTYGFEKNICRILGLIVGENKFLELYLTNDMQSLSNICLHYLDSNDEEIFLNFIRAIDFLYVNRSKSLNKTYVGTETCKEIGTFLSKMFINSLIEEAKILKSNGISTKEIYMIQQSKIEKFTRLMKIENRGLSLDIKGTLELLNKEETSLQRK